MTTPTDPTALAPMTGDALIRGTRLEVAPVEGGYFDLLVAYADRLASGDPVAPADHSQTRAPLESGSRRKAAQSGRATARPR